MSARIQLVQATDVRPHCSADVEDLRMAWRDAAADARDAYRYWSDAARGDMRTVYAAYLAVADRETVAAEALSAFRENSGRLRLPRRREKRCCWRSGQAEPGSSAMAVTRWRRQIRPRTRPAEMYDPMGSPRP
jgi:hypothetical protein